MSNHPVLGQLIDPQSDPRRDALHVSVAPFTASRRLLTGQRFKLDDQGQATPSDAGFAIVDPFLSDGCVLKGERFWGLMLPGSVINLRHEWESNHIPAPPAPEATVVIKEVPAVIGADLQAVIDFAKRKGLTLEEVISEANDNLNAECRGCN